MAQAADIDLLVGFGPDPRIDAPWPVAASSFRPLGGQYRLSAQGMDAEIELIEMETARRSIVYIHGGESLSLFVASGVYRFRVRLMSPPGRYAEARIGLWRMSVFDRLVFYARRLAGLAKRPPGEWLGVVARGLHPSAQGVTGARMTAVGEAPQAQAAEKLPARLAQSLKPHRKGRVSVIIPTKARPELISACVTSLDMSPIEKDIVIIDNGATDPLMRACLQALDGRPDVRVLRHDIPFNFSRLCNLGAAAALHDWLLFLNDDIEALDADWLGHMLAWTEQPRTGVVGARLLYPSRDLQHAGIASNLVPGPGHPWRQMPEARWQSHPLVNRPGEVDAVTAACLLIGRDLFNALGGFDETRFAVTLNDVDLCLKARAAGRRIIYAPDATLLHKEGQSRQGDDHPEQCARREAELQAFYALYPEAAEQSLFYPPNLRRDGDSGLPA
jgi:GT2 family glycosyltransferase